MGNDERLHTVGRRPPREQVHFDSSAICWWLRDTAARRSLAPDFTANKPQGSLPPSMQNRPVLRTANG